MNQLFLKKMIQKALKDYLWDEEDFILTEKEWEQLKTEVMEQIKEENQEEAIYVIVQDVVYDYFTKK
jgi:cytochrome b involved in lipid metabolism